MAVAATGTPATEGWKRSLISFASGAAFGATSVVTAQPFDVIKVSPLPPSLFNFTPSD